MRIIEDAAFIGCTTLESISIPDSVTKIGKSTFSSCTNLNNIVIPDSVEVIERYAFSGCTGLTSVVIPNAATVVANDAFDENTKVIVKTDGRLTLKQYISGLQYVFEEFDKEDYDGSFYTRDGRLDELFDHDQIDKSLDEDKKKYLDEMGEEEIHDILFNLVMNLDQGAIKSLEITDGDKTLYEDSNDEPYED